MLRRATAAACRFASQLPAMSSQNVSTCIIGRTSRIWLMASEHGAWHARLNTTEQILWQQRRSFSSSLDVSKEVDAVNELFVAAREEIEYAKEEAETVYFNESVQEAKRAVDACLGRWEALLAALPEEDRNRVVRGMGLKIAQLQAEYDEVSKLHLED